MCLIIGHSTDIIANDLADNVPQGEGLLGAPHAHQRPPPTGNTVQPFLFDNPPPPQTLAQQTPQPYAGNAVQTTAPPSATAYPIPPGYAPASQRIPGANTAQPTPSASASSPYPGAQPPTPQVTKADSPLEPLPKKRGRGRPAGSRDKEKRDPKGTHAGKTKGELSKLARERAKRRRLDAERAEEGEGLGQEQRQVSVQGWAEQQIPVQQSALGSGQQIPVQEPDFGSGQQIPVQPAFGSVQQVPVQQPDFGSGKQVPIQQPTLGSGQQIHVQQPALRSVQQAPVQQLALGSVQQAPIQQPTLRSAQQIPLQQPANGWAGQYNPTPQPALNPTTQQTLAEQMQSPRPDRFGWQNLMTNPSRQSQLPPSPPNPADELADVAAWVKQP